MTKKSQDERQALTAEVHAVLSDKTQKAISDRETLRDAVCVFVTAERVRGTTLKSLIQTVEEILRKAERAAESVTDATEARASALAKQLVDWCMEFQRTARVASA
jgi:hypothetical protein